MDYVLDELLNEIPLQSSTASTGDTPNIDDTHDDIPCVKHIDRKKTKKEVELKNSLIENVKTFSKSEDNNLLASVASLVAEMLGVKTKQKSEKGRKKPYCRKRPIENKFKAWRKHLSNLEEVCKGNHILCGKDKKRDDS